MSNSYYKLEVIKIKKNQKKFVLVCIFAFLVYLINAITIVSVMAAPIYTLQTETNAFKYIAAAIAVAGSGIGAGIGIGQTGSSAIALISEKESGFVKAFIIVSLAEAVAIYGLVVALLLIFT